jgi:hypothetical protein
MIRETGDRERARAAKKKAARVFAAYGKVVGVGITRVEGEYALKVNFEESPSPSAELPTEIDGVPVVVRTVGTIRKQA